MTTNYIPLMRPSNCSDPGVREKICVIKKGGALENEGIKVINWGGAR